MGCSIGLLVPLSGSVPLWRSIALLLGRLAIPLLCRLMVLAVPVLLLGLPIPLLGGLVVLGLLPILLLRLAVLLLWLPVPLLLGLPILLLRLPVPLLWCRLPVILRLPIALLAIGRLVVIVHGSTWAANGR
jgi:hypothetical protein